MTKTTFIERAASAVGSAVRAFELSRSGEDGHGRAHRPNFLTSQAQEGRWKGGVFNGEKSDAARRSVQNSWIYMMIQRKAMEKSAARLYVVDNPEGLEDTGTVIKGHPFQRILRNPNPHMDGSFLSQYMDWWQDLLGENFLFLAPDEDGNLAEMWPMPANAVNPVPGDKDRFIDYYEYTANGILYRIPAEYVYHEKYPNPFDIFRGLSPLVAAILPADSDSAMAFWNGQFFGQDNVMPSASINLSSGIPGQPIDPADLQAVKDELANEYAAINRKTIVTNAYDMAVNLLGWNAKDMDFMNGRTFTKEEIILILGGFPGMFDKNATEANSTSSDNMFKEKTIWPLLGQRAGAMTAQILRRFYSKSHEARYEDMRPINQQLLIQQSQATADVLLIDERRKRFWKLEPLPNGQGQRLSTEAAAPEWTPAEASTETSSGPGAQSPAASSQTSSADPAVDPNASLKPTSPSASLANQIENSKALTDDLRAWRRRSLKSLEDGRPMNADFRTDVIPADTKALILDGLEAALSADDVKAIFTDAQKGIIRSWRPWSGYEMQLTDEIEQIFADQLHDLIERIRATGTANPLTDPVVWAQNEIDMRTRLAPLIKDLANYAAKRVQQTVSTTGGTGTEINWNLANENAEAYARQHAGEMIKGITDTTKNALADVVAKWSQTGEGIDGLIKRVGEMTNDGGKPIFNSVRAEMIGITEATNIYAGANNEAWSAAGYSPAAKKPGAHVKCRCYIQPYKMADGTKVMVWYTARDERVCRQPLNTPWGEVKGCAELHRTVISEGKHMGAKV